MRVQNDATSLNDKLRIANKVNSKYLESLADKSKLLEELELESADTNSLLSFVDNSKSKTDPPGNRIKSQEFLFLMGVVLTITEH